MSKSSQEQGFGASDGDLVRRRGDSSHGGMEKRRHKPKHRQGRLLNSTYQLGEEIGRGSSGKVYRALNRETGDFRAIKEIPTQNMPVGHLESVQSEIDLLHNLQHPQIVRYFETVRTEAHLYLVLEYVENGSLASIVKNFGRFPEHLVVTYVRQVLTGLEWLHEHGVCHRDIKGANLLVTKDGQVKLADFGVARKLSDVAQSTSVVGTPYWMAPEIIQMSAFTTASDIWSLGCTIIELINGEPPHYDLAPISALYRIVQDPKPPFPQGISPLLVDFLSRCFTRDPEKRATAAHLRQHDWLRVEPESLSNESGTTNAAAQRIGQLAVRQLQMVSTLNPGGAAAGGSHQAHEDDALTHDSVSSAQGEVPRTGAGDVSGYASDSNTLHSLGSKGHSNNYSNHSHNHSTSHHSANHSANGYELKHANSMPHGAHGHSSPPGQQSYSHASSRRREEQRNSNNRDGSRDGSSGRGDLKVRPPPPGSPPFSGQPTRHMSDRGVAEATLPLGSRDRKTGVGSGSYGNNIRPKGHVPSSSESPSRPPQLVGPEGSATAPPPRSASFSGGLRGEGKSPVSSQVNSSQMLPPSLAHSGSSVEAGFRDRERSASKEILHRPLPTLSSPQSRPTEFAASYCQPEREMSTDSASSLSHSHTFLSAPLHAPPHTAQSHPHQVPPAHPPPLQLQLGGASDKLRNTAASAPAPEGAEPMGSDRRWLQDELVRMNKAMGQSGSSIGVPPLVLSDQCEQDSSQSSPKPYQICLPGSEGYATGGDAPLSGYLWKRGSSWRSLTYQRRFFYLANEALCYRAKAPSIEHGMADGAVEKRIALASVLNVRVHSKLKFEFELVCTSRSFRLRAPSAQALAVWVTTISAEWMQLHHKSTQKAVNDHQMGDAPASAGSTGLPATYRSILGDTRALSIRQSPYSTCGV